MEVEVYADISTATVDSHSMSCSFFLPSLGSEAVHPVLFHQRPVHCICISDHFHEHVHSRFHYTPSSKQA